MCACALGRAAGLMAMRDPAAAPEDVERPLRQAVELYRAWEAPLFLALTQADLGTWLTGQGRTDEAAAALARFQAAWARADVQLGGSRF